MDFILDVLNETVNESTDLSNVDSSNVELKRDEKGNLVSYDKNTGKIVDRICEHGIDEKGVAKTFDEIMRKE